MTKKSTNNVRDILNKIKWDRDLEKAEIWYIHRGATNHTKVISGNEILNIGRSFFDTSSFSIPFHRILKIIYDGDVLFNRKQNILSKLIYLNLNNIIIFAKYF